MWVDQINIEEGKNWDRSIDQALKSCDGMIFMISPGSLQSDNVLDEVYYGREMEKHIIPLKIKDIEISDLPYKLRRMEFIDYASGSALAFQKLLKTLQIEDRKSIREVYLSYHLDQNSIELADIVQRMITSLGIQVFAGKRMAGKNLTKKQKQHLDRADILICILAQESKKINTDLIRAQLDYFDLQGKHSLVILDKAIEDRSLVQGGREFIEYNPHAPADALTNLAITITFWKQGMGKIIEVILGPDEVLDLLRLRIDTVTVRYRLLSDDYSLSKWIETKPIFQPGGISIYVDGVLDDSMIEVKIKDGQTTWSSNFQSQKMLVNLYQE